MLKYHPRTLRAHSEQHKKSAWCELFHELSLWISFVVVHSLPPTLMGDLNSVIYLLPLCFNVYFSFILFFPLSFFFILFCCWHFCRYSWCSGFSLHVMHVPVLSSIDYKHCHFDLTLYHLLMDSPVLLHFLFEQITNNSNKTNQIVPNRQTLFYFHEIEDEQDKVSACKNNCMDSVLELWCTIHSKRK